MHQLLFVICVVFFSVNSSFSQWLDNSTPTYPELIEHYKELTEKHDEIELYNMGQSDFGLPIYLCVINGEGDSLNTFTKAKKSTTILINNGIHPGEPDGINACLMWIDEWIENGKHTEGMPVIGFIPAYNVGGAMNRSGSSRANQNGPEEYGFRGNAQNLDLNRDFIKMDSENAFTFAQLFHSLDPDVFIDTHVSNGADYQYTLTYIASVKERMAPSLGTLVHEEMIPWIAKDLEQKKFPMIPYVNLLEDTPEKGMSVFNDLPRYSMGYTALFNTISFTVETHMLKPFDDRVQSTLAFLESTLDWVKTHQSEIEKARSDAFQYDLNTTQFPYNYQLSDAVDSINFMGFEHEYIPSEVTGLDRLKYYRDRPFTMNIPYRNVYVAQDTLSVPKAYVIPRYQKEVLARLKANNIEMEELKKSTLQVNKIRILDFKSAKAPYEGHFIHSGTSTEVFEENQDVYAGDFVVLVNQRNKRFLLNVLEPTMPDSYFAWNFYDSHLQQKEYFSPYVFEDFAAELLEENPALKLELEEKKKSNKAFAENSWAQLYFIYQHSKFYEPTHNILPIYFWK